MRRWLLRLLLRFAGLEFPLTGDSGIAVLRLGPRAVVVLRAEGDLSADVCEWIQQACSPPSRTMSGASSPKDVFRRSKRFCRRVQRSRNEEMMAAVIASGVAQHPGLEPDQIAKRSVAIALAVLAEAQKQVPETE